jgi:hypothetical protein
MTSDELALDDLPQPEEETTVSPDDHFHHSRAAF